MTAHSHLGASGAHRWWHCPGSIRECAKVPSHTSVYAAEGSAAHTLASHLLTVGGDLESIIGWRVDFDYPSIIAPNSEAWKEAEPLVGETVFEITEDMAEAVQVYLDYAASIIEPGDEVTIEQRFDLNYIHDGMFGTADLTVYKPETRHLYVVDYKHGRGVPVEVADNPQLLYYALGAATHKHSRGLDRVTAVVVQPRCPHPDGPVREWTVDALDLLDWSADLAAAVERTLKPDAPLATGDWCRFCDAAAVCPAAHDKALRVAQAEFTEGGDLMLPDPTGYKPELLSRVLRHEVDFLEDWCRAVRDFAHHEAEAGRTPPGFKLVATRATRKWKSEDRVREFLAAFGLSQKDMETDPKLKSPAQIEKTIGKKNKDIIADLYESVSSGTVLAPLDDKRPPVRSEAVEDFA